MTLYKPSLLESVIDTTKHKHKDNCWKLENLYQGMETRTPKRKWKELTVKNKVMGMRMKRKSTINVAK